MARRLLGLVVAALAGLALAAGPAVADPGTGDDAAKPRQEETPRAERPDAGDDCRPGVPIVDDIAEGVCDVGSGAIDAVTGLPRDAAEAVRGTIMDQLTKWMADAASWVTKEIAKAIQATTTPELDAGWYRERFASMAALGLGLALLVAMLALGSAAIRRDPEALGATVLGMFRAGLGTGLVLALTVMALGLADAVTNTIAGDAVGRNASKFWGDVAGAWGKDNFAGVGSSAVAFFLALVQVIAAIAVWIELLLRQAAIYVAVLFLPVALAASIWPALRSWQSRLIRALFVLVAMKPVVVAVLSLAGSAAAAAISGQARGEVGVLLTAIVIFALAAWAPWALMHLVSMDHESVWSARGGTDGSRGAVREGSARVGGTIGRATRTPGVAGSGRPGGAGRGRGPGSQGGGPGRGDKPVGPNSPAGSGGGAPARAGTGAAGSSATAGGAGASAAGATGAVAAAAGMTAQTSAATGRRAGQTASAATAGGGSARSGQAAGAGRASAAGGAQTHGGASGTTGTSTPGRSPATPGPGASGSAARTPAPRTDPPSQGRSGGGRPQAPSPRPTRRPGTKA